MTLQHRLRAHLQAGQWLPQGMRILVAVSGGLDSVVLLDLLVQEQPRWQWELAVAHFEHDWRAESEAGFVVRLATRYGLPCFVNKLAARPAAARRGRGYEEAARHERYKALARIAAAWHAGAVVTGHHRDDQTETVLFRLLRGTSPGGLGGMAPARALAAGSNVRLVRPLLPFSRAELETTATSRGLTWCEDTSNTDPRFLRNRIRHEAVPLLEAIRPGAAGQIASLADLARRDEAYWQQALQSLPTGWQRQEPTGGISVNTAFLAELPEPLRRRCLEHLLRWVGPRAVTSGHILQLEALLEHPEPGAVSHLPHGWIAQREYERLYLLPDSGARPSPSFPAPCLLPLGAGVDWPGGRLTVALTEGPPPVEAASRSQQPRPSAQTGRRQPSTATAWLRAGSLPAEVPLLVRSRQPGDRLRPAGGAGSKKLQDVFTQAKVPRAWRDMWPVVCRADTGELLWVTGLAVAQAYAATPDCAGAIVLHWLPHGPHS